jgi:hypothetical protein
VIQLLGIFVLVAWAMTLRSAVLTGRAGGGVLLSAMLGSVVLAAHAAF